AGSGETREHTSWRQSTVQRQQLAVRIHIDASPDVGSAANPSPVAPAETLAAEAQGLGVGDGNRPLSKLLGDLLQSRHASSLAQSGTDHNPACSDGECCIRTIAHVFAAVNAAVVRMRSSRGLGTPRLYECAVHEDEERRDRTNAELPRTANAALVRTCRSGG